MNKSAQLVGVEWRDLVALTPWEKAWELLLGLPWLLLSFWCYSRGWWWAGLACSFYVFLTGLRQSHNAQHYALGLPRLAQDGVLFGLSLLMLASMHAVQVTHLHHHRHCLEKEDEEGAAARLAWWQALLVGPLFYIRLHRSAWRLAGPRKRMWIACEVIAAALVLFFAVCVTRWIALQWHLAAMLLGECCTGFFAVWTVHHGCAAHEPGRTQRGQWMNRISYSMFFHAEHHLFPAVPTGHLCELARRLDAAVPAFSKPRVIRLGPKSDRVLVDTAPQWVRTSRCDVPARVQRAERISHRPTSSNCLRRWTRRGRRSAPSLPGGSAGMRPVRPEPNERTGHMTVTIVLPGGSGFLGQTQLDKFRMRSRM